MAKLIYMMNTSLDGYIENEHGSIDFAAPLDDEVRAWLFPYASSFRTVLYGRRMYETMLYWETAHTLPLQTKLGNDFARLWQAAEKIVYSKTLAEPLSGHTTIARAFDPDAVRQLKATTEHDMAVSGPELAAHAIQAGLVDEIQVRISPVLVGGGKRFFPAGVRLDLELLEERRFRCGDIFLRYAVRGQDK
jgi:dihydrofolate reductase